MQQLPQNIEAEQNVLGSIIKNNNCLVDIISILKPEDFYNSAHKIIYNNISEMFKNNIPIDTTTLVNKLGKDNLVSIGGITYIAKLTDSIPSTKNSKMYAEIVKEKADRRRIIKASEKALNEAYNEGKEPGNIISHLEDNLLQIGTNENTIRTESEVMEETLNMIQDNFSRGGDITGMTTGFKTLDRAINGLNKGDLVIIAARPSMGKSLFSLNIARELAKDNVVLNFSLEMSNKKLALRKLASETLINSNKLRMGKLTDEEWKRLANKSSILVSNSKMLYDDTAGLTLQQMKARCKKVKLKYGRLDAIIIDHLGLMISTLKTDDKRKVIEDITNNLKRMAKELDICVIALSQLSRAPDIRAEHRPQLSDLRESGSIEQDADCVIGLYRDEYYDPETLDKDILEAILLKNRDGQLGTIKLGYNAEYQFIAEIPQQKE